MLSTHIPPCRTMEDETLLVDCALLCFRGSKSQERYRCCADRGSPKEVVHLAVWHTLAVCSPGTLDRAHDIPERGPASLKVPIQQPSPQILAYNQVIPDLSFHLTEYPCIMGAATTSLTAHAACMETMTRTCALRAQRRSLLDAWKVAVEVPGIHSQPSSSPCLGDRNGRSQGEDYAGSPTDLRCLFWKQCSTEMSFQVLRLCWHPLTLSDGIWFSTLEKFGSLKRIFLLATYFPFLLTI